VGEDEDLMGISLESSHESGLDERRWSSEQSVGEVVSWGGKGEGGR
jgi:hypothetical protein